MHARKKSVILKIAAVAALLILAHQTIYEDLRPTIRKMYFLHIRGTPLIKEVPRTIVDCNSVISSDTMVALVLGQSNSANFGNKRNSTDRPVYSFYEGSCYQAIDPMPGADGDGGSVWPLVGDSLIKNGRYKSVVFITIGVSSSSVARWAPGGDLHKNIIDSWRGAKSIGLTITHVLWHQGEEDMLLKTPRNNYYKSLKSVIDSTRSAGISAPFYIATASYCGGQFSESVTSAQTTIVNKVENTFAGPNTDQIVGATDRYDQCHLTAAGMDKFSDAWVSSLLHH